MDGGEFWEGNLRFGDSDRGGSGFRLVCFGGGI